MINSQLQVINSQLQVGVVFGTRPEAIKLAPVIAELKQHPNEFKPYLISTAQHRSMLDQVIEVFRISPDIDLDLMQPNQTLNSLTCRVLQAMDSVARYSFSRLPHRARRHHDGHGRSPGVIPIARSRWRTWRPDCAAATY